MNRNLSALSIAACLLLASFLWPAGCSSDREKVHWVGHEPPPSKKHYDRNHDKDRHHEKDRWDEKDKHHKKGKKDKKP